MPLLPAAIAIVLNDDQSSVLLTQRRDVPVWVLPGGGVEDGESPEEALLREVQEETGLVVDIIRKSAEYTPVNRLAAPTTVYICKIKSGVMQLSNETAAAIFYPLDQLPSSFFSPHSRWLQEGLTSEDTIRRPLNEISYGALLRHLASHPLEVVRFAWTRFIKTRFSGDK